MPAHNSVTMQRSLDIYLLQQAQHEADLSDDEFLGALELVTDSLGEPGRSRNFASRQIEKLMAYLEAIYWRKADAGQLQAAGGRAAVFKQRGYWADFCTLQGFLFPDRAEIQSGVVDSQADQAFECIMSAAMAEWLRAKGFVLLPGG